MFHCRLSAPKLAFILLIHLCASSATLAQTPDGGGGNLSAGPNDIRELETFLDGLFPQTMEELHVPGAVFVLVRNGEIFFKKGYGFANLETRKLVDPDKTIFRIASVSKLITVTAVMQLHERGLVNLNDDVNDYLERFEIPATFPQPITFAHLITHTAGFDDNRIGLATQNEEDLLPLGDFLAEALPPRVRPPGREYSYSRHGIALAGYLVEVVSGQTFSDYVERNILQPLGMTRSTFRFPRNFTSDLAMGYSYRHRAYDAVPYYYFQTGPEAAFNTTATDMAAFMIAQLHGGVFEDGRILAEATVRFMQARHFAHDTRLPGLAYGFYERFENGERALQHGGHIPGFVSRLILLPEKDVGFFMACNNDRFKLLSTVTERFFDHYFSVGDSTAVQSTGAGKVRDLSRFSGFYRTNEYSRSSIEKIFSLRKQFRISVTDEGNLLVRGKQLWTPVGPLVFRNAVTGELSVFKEDGQGKVDRWYRKRFAFEKLRFYETLSFHLAVFGSAALVFLLGCLVWLGGNRMRIMNLKIRAAATERRLLRLTGVMSSVNLLFLSGLTFLFLSHDRIDEFTFGIPPFVIALLTLPLLSIALTFAAMVLVVKYWKSSATRVGVYFVALILTSLLFLVELNYWNLVGFRF